MAADVRRVLVFDSGVGGLSVLDPIAAEGRAIELDYAAADTAWLPYGLESEDALRARVPRLLAGHRRCLDVRRRGGDLQHGLDRGARGFEALQDIGGLAPRGGAP
ncbi:MAG: hypothetical protein R3F35_05315 [Myxococcota bacterium]